MTPYERIMEAFRIFLKYEPVDMNANEFDTSMEVRYEISIEDGLRLKQLNWYPTDNPHVWKEQL